MESYTLSELATVLGGEIIGNGDCVVTEFVNDSRTVSTGSLYFAIRGTSLDGHKFLPAVFSCPAAAVVEDPSTVPNGSSGIVVSDTRKAWSQIQSFKYGYPSKELLVVGVTGTNGKTTIQWMITQGLVNAGQNVLRVGTLGAHFSKFLEEESLTTPDPADLQRYLSVALQNSGTAAALEVSSHALTQDRVSDVEFDVAVFSNLTQDHGDYHGSMEDYFEAKARLFGLSQKSAVVCCDSEWGQKLITRISDTSLKLLSYGYHDSADVKVENFSQDISGSSFEICFQDSRASFSSSFIGKYNAQNLAAALAVLLVSGYKFDKAANCLRGIPLAPGRLESVGTSDKGIFVDYSHTPDSLENALMALQEVEHNELWVVFGCGGDRDKTKRPQMGAVAAKLADHVVVTSDNPRTEDPEKIIDDILAAQFSPRHVEADREKAISYAVNSMSPGDLLLVAGKGHEDYQIIGTEKIHMSDQEIVRKALG